MLWKVSFDDTCLGKGNAPFFLIQELRLSEAKLAYSGFVENELFCNTSFPLASTRWVRLTLSRLWPLFLAVPSINLSTIKRKILGIAENRTLGCWVRSSYATSVQCSPLENELHYYLKIEKPKVLPTELRPWRRTGSRRTGCPQSSRSRSPSPSLSGIKDEASVVAATCNYGP